MVELLRGEEREGIGAEGIEGDVAEVEQARPADRDVEAEREQDVEERVDPDLGQVVRPVRKGQATSGTNSAP